MILTVTLNAALDVTYRIDELRPHTTHRVGAVAYRPGGKGVNVAAVLTQLREPAVATGLCGGTTGAQIRLGLADSGIPDAFVPIAGDSRRTLVVADDTDATGFWEPGPQVTAAEWDTFLHRYRGLAKVARVVVLSGSLPAGLPEDAYAQLVTVARELSVPSVLDTDGAALWAGLAAGPDVVKPNLAELAAVTQSELGTIGEVLDAADLLRDAGAGAVVVSRGARGLLASTVDGMYRVAPPEPVAGNPTGAGDAAVAALARGLSRQDRWPEILADTVSLSAAAAATPLAGTVDGSSYDRFRQIAVVETV